MRLQFERRLVPLDSWRMVTVLTVGAVLLLTQASMDAELTVMMPLTLLLAKGPRPV